MAITSLKAVGFVALVLVTLFTLFQIQDKIRSYVRDSDLRRAVALDKPYSETEKLYVLECASHTNKSVLTCRHEYELIKGVK